MPIPLFKFSVKDNTLTVHGLFIVFVFRGSRDFAKKKCRKGLSRHTRREEPPRLHRATFLEKGRSKTDFARRADFYSFFTVLLLVWRKVSPISFQMPSRAKIQPMAISFRTAKGSSYTAH